MAVAVASPFQGWDLAPTTTGQEKPSDGGGQDLAIMPCQHLSETASFLPGQDPFAPSAPVPPDVPARIASFRAVALDLGFSQDLGQDRHSQVGNCWSRPERSEPLSDIPVGDGTNRLLAEPGNDLVLQMLAIDPERARLPASDITAGNRLATSSNGVSAKPSVGLEDSPLLSPSRRERASSRASEKALFRHLQWSSTPGARCSGREQSNVFGRQDPDAKPSEGRFSDVTDGLVGFMGIDSTLGQANIGHGVSPESVASANRNPAEWPFPELDAREKTSLMQTVMFCPAPKLRPPACQHSETVPETKNPMRWSR